MMESTGQAKINDVALSTMWAIKRFSHLTDFFAAAQGMGFHHFELNHQVDSRMLEGLDYDHIAISSVHEPCPADIPVSVLKARRWLLSDTAEDNRQQGVQSILRSIDLARAAGTRFVVVHLGTVSIPSQWEDDLRKLYDQQKIDSEQAESLRRNMIAERARLAPAHLAAVHKSLDELAAYASRSNVCLGIENRYHFADIPHPDEMEMLLPKDASRQVGFWYDSGHAEALDRLGFFPHAAWLQRFSGHLMGTHLHDIRGIDDHLAPGLGEIDWGMVARYVPGDVLRTLEIKPGNSPEAVVSGVQRLAAVGLITVCGG